MMDHDNHMVTSDVDHGDDDDIEIDVDLPQAQEHDPYNQDAMIDDVSITSENLEDADMVDDDGHYADEEINDEPMEYYDEDLDAPIEDAPEPHENLPDEEMAPVEDEMVQPQQQEEVQASFVPHQAGSPHAEAIAPLQHEPPTTVEPSIGEVQHAYIEHTNEVKILETNEVQEQPVTTAQPDGLEHKDAAPEPEQLRTIDKDVRSPTEQPAQAVTADDTHKQQPEVALDVAANAEETTAEETAEAEVKPVESHHEVDVEGQEVARAPQEDEAQPAETERAPEEEHHQDYSVTDASLALHSIKVIYQESEIYLFPPPESDPNDTFFLKDESLAGQPMGELLRACREVLGTHITPQEVLFLEIDRLGLSFVERPSQPYTMSLYEIVEVYLHLCANDDVNVPEPMYIALHSRLDANSEFANLLEAVQKGQGLSYFEAYEEDETEGPETEGAPDQGNVQHYLEAGEEGEEGREEGEAADDHLKQESQLAPEGEAGDGNVHEDDHAGEEETQQEQPPQEIENEGVGIQDAIVTPVQSTSQEAVSGKASPPHSSEDLPTEAAPHATSAAEPQQATATGDIPAPQGVEDHVPETTSQDVGLEQPEVELGHETGNVDQEDSQESVSDLGNQTIAEYEGETFDHLSGSRIEHSLSSQSSGTEYVSEHAATGDSSASFTASAEQSATNGPHSGSVAEGHHDYLEQADHEVPQSVGQEHDSAPKSAHDQALDNLNAETDFNAEKAEDTHEPEELNEDRTGEDEDEEAPVAEYEDEYREADSDNELEEPLEGIDIVEENDANAVDDNGEAVATDNNIPGDAPLNDDVNRDLQSNEEVPVGHDGMNPGAPYGEEEEDLLGQDIDAPEHYDNSANAEDFDDHEDRHDQSHMYDNADNQGGLVGNEIIVMKGVEEDDVASVKRLREEDEVEGADAKRLRS